MKSVALASLLLATVVEGASAQAVATAAQTSPAHSDWPKYCGNLGMTGTAQSAGNLSNRTAPFYALSWSAKLSGPIASQPTVVGDLVYVGDWSGMEWALDAATGITVAQAYLGTTSAPQCEPPNLGITSSGTVSNGILYVAGGDSLFYALDAQTLEIVWSQYLGDNSAEGGYYGWCSPVVAGSKVIQGVASDCDNPFVAGRVVGLGLFDGSLTSEALLITPDWPHDLTGSGVWTSPSVDEPNKSVFVTTASANQIDDGYAYSIVRLDLDSLSIQESWRLTDVDPLADADWGTSPTLFTDSNGNQLVGAGEKDGHYYAFQRRSLASGPVWKTQLALGGACPTCADGVLSTAAFDGTRLYVGSGRPPDQADDITGAVYALNPDDGTILWQHLLTAPVIAPISYANGVVFTTAGKSAVALDAQTGVTLWQTDTEEICVGGVAVTDRGIVFGDMAGNLYAYAIPPNVSTKTRALRSR